LLRFAYWMCADRALAQRLVRQALRRAWRSFDSLQEQRTAKHWLIAIVRREVACLSEREGAAALLDSASPSISGSTPPASREVQQMRLAILRLELTDREPLLLQLLMGCPLQQIACLMDVTEAEVLARLRRARQRLHELMAGRRA
jgi:RNA polymerase sigma-70 factor (ECF subfamily)